MRPLWDIARPEQPNRVPGVAMAGFADRGSTPPELRMIPHPAVTLIVAFGGTIAVEDTTGHRQRGSFAAGPGFGEVLRVRWEKDVECLQVRLSPVVAHAVLGPAVADLDGGAAPLDALWGREAARIGERLGELSSWPERFAVIEAWIARRRAAASPVDREVMWAWERIVAGQGRIRIEDLANELGWSRKRLWSRFQAQLGLPPKRTAKLVRFDHAVHRLVAGQHAAEVAADSGYADQSHLHRDVVAFTSRTPATVVDEPFLAIDDVAWGRPSPVRRR
jgi:AraC-like DNA-binding protein